MAVGAVCRHDASQEPGAVVPHAGICGGGGQQWLSLLRLKPLRCAAASQIKKQARMLAQYQMKKRAQSQIKKQPRVLATISQLPFAVRRNAAATRLRHTTDVLRARL